MLRDFKAYQLAKEIHWECRRLNLPQYTYGQLMRASSSIALNLAEGSAKRSSADQRRYYMIAYSSLRECEAILDLERLHSAKVFERLNLLGGILYRLTKPLQTSDPRPKTSD